VQLTLIISKKQEGITLIYVLKYGVVPEVKTIELRFFKNIVPCCCLGYVVFQMSVSIEFLYEE